MDVESQADLIVFSVSSVQERLSCEKCRREKRKLGKRADEVDDLS